MHARIPATVARRVSLAVIALAALVGVGCSQKLVSELIPNQPPEVRLTAAPVARDPDRPYFYSYLMQWVGYDPDGRVSHFVYAVDPMSNTYDPADTATWRVTSKNESTFVFMADSSYDIGNISRGEAPHTLTIYAVDDKGLVSVRPATRSFFSFTQCPSVQILEPLPNAAFTPNVTPTVTLRWTGSDPDGQDPKPKFWVFRLFGQRNPDFPGIDNFITFARIHSDSLRVLYAPEFPGWRRLPQDTTSFQYRGLTPDQSYLFVITGFDEAGAYDPKFDMGRNMLEFGVTYAGTFGPEITMFNQFFFYRYDIGGYDAREERWFHLEVPADQTVTFNWLADPPPGADIRRYRWAMDLQDLTDQTPRRNEASDWCHWSAWSRNTTSATIGPFLDASGNFIEYCGQTQNHFFYIEAEDNNGLVSLGIINFVPVISTFEKDLLFVDDTRLRVDLDSDPSVPGVDPPAGVWPTAAELDSFLFARGNVPWRSYPPGTLSTPGIFNGYSYDTVGTRGFSLDGTVPLSVLGLYKHVVWYTDAAGASYTGFPTDRSTPITALRLVNSPGRPVILSTYMTQGFKTAGGNVWLSGGGAAYAAMVTWNRTGTSLNEFESRQNELIPGRMMFDFVHWREGIQMLPGVNLRRFGTTTFGVGTNRPGRHWPSSPPLPTPPNPPDYTLLPANLNPKTPATDPVPALRNNDSFFYQGTFSAEYIFRPTFIREDYNPDPDIEQEFSTLDTLYIVRGGTALLNAPAMTYYHGLDNQPLIFSGFNFWYWQREHCIGLVDWVLQSVWGLPRDPTASRNPSTAVASRRAQR